MNDVTSRILSIIVERFKLFGIKEFDLEKELSIPDPVSGRFLSEEEKEFVRGEVLKKIQYKSKHDEAILVPVSIVEDPREHEEWYEEWFNANDNLSGSYYWKRLEDFLSFELTKKYGPESAGIIVKSIDDATFKTMTRLANPLRNEFSYKGLVMGYVQSGKTANFTALIAKAVDAGYKFIIVLAGIHNVLRRQTQIRLDRELTGIKDIEGPDDYISLPGAAKLWNRLTTAHNDFNTSNLGLFSTYCERETPTLAVIKKNVSILEKLIEYVSQASEDLLSNMPVLIIDDEADQASIDTSANTPDTDPSRTNGCIRNLLSHFSRKVYLGYTATPFANVLIDMNTEHGTLQDDLYPRNFIVSLPEPAGYFGTSMIFDGDLSDKFVKVIPNEANELIRRGRMTENLSTAIDQFILCCAVRNLRGDKSKPMSMLVHVSHRINDMTVISGIVSNYLDDIVGRINDPSQQGNLKLEFEQVWENFSSNTVIINSELGLANLIPTFELIWEEINNVLDILKVMELNSASYDTLDYSTRDEIKVIAIGGNQLSRGLTLEGLMTSYYLRSSRQYDTLLQMGRWFGYRRGYEDLTRIHTTQQIWDFFEHLSLVEEELRSEIYRYEEVGLTPVQLAVAIRDHQNLSITAKNKMGAGRTRQSSYSNSINQTIWLPLNHPESLRANYHLGDSFIRRIQNEKGFINIENKGTYLARMISGEIILDFLNHYHFVDKNELGGAGLDDESLLAYIHRRLFDSNPELTQWNVAVPGNANSIYPNDPIKYGGLDLNRLGRSRKNTNQGYNIGVLTESAHLRIDLEQNASSPHDGRSPQNPLLLLYLIAKESEARVSGQRVDLYKFIDSEKIDVLGIAIVLPKSQYEPFNYVGQ